MGSVGSNVLSLVFGLICIYAFWRILKKLEAPNWFLLLFTFAFLPIFMKSASSTMDYLPALSVLLFAWLSLLQRRYWVAFLLIGLAVGFRPTHGFFLLPALVLAYSQGRKWGSLALYAVGTCLAALLAYSPVLFEYGILNPWLGHGFDVKMNLLIWGYNFSLLFGIVPSMGILLVVLVHGLRRKRTERKSGDAFPGGRQVSGKVEQGGKSGAHPQPDKPSTHWGFHWANIAVWLILFTLLPHEPEYLIPAIPSLLLMLNAKLPRTALLIISVLLLSYHFVRLDLLGGESGQRKIELSVKPGFTRWDRQDRKFKKFLRKAADAYDPEQPTLFMEGASYIPVRNKNWEYFPEERFFKHKSHEFYLSHPILDPSELKRRKAEGYRIVVWKQRKWQYVRSGTDEWREYVDIVDDLSLFFDARIKGKPLK